MRNFQAVTLMLLVLGVHAAAVAGSAEDPMVSVHPAHPSAQGEFLILIDHALHPSCLGPHRISVSSDQIVYLEQPGAPICPPFVGPPTQRLFNPRDFAAPNLAFAPLVTVSYALQFQDQPPQVLASVQVEFDQQANGLSTVDNGGWVNVTSEVALEQSGLFIDQQDNLLTVALLDYNQDGQSHWAYAAGPVDGDVFSADLVSYQIQCFDHSCANRKAPRHVGRINLLLREHDKLLANYRYDRAFLSGPGDDPRALTYQRVRFGSATRPMAGPSE